MVQARVVELAEAEMVVAGLARAVAARAVEVARAAAARAAARVTAWVSRSNLHYNTFHNRSSTLERGDGPRYDGSCSLRTSHIAHNGGGGRGSTTAERSKTALSTKKLVNV